MRNGTPGFQAARLVEARESRGLSQVALADLIDRTPSSISRWEARGQSPEPQTLSTLANSLNVPQSFFLNPPPEHGNAPMFFRSMASTTQMMRKRARARLRWAQDISLSLQEWVDLPEVDVPRLDIEDYREISDKDIETAAAKCRDVWGLGSGPISDLLLVLENAGIVIVKDEVGTVKMDGLSNWSAADGRPYMLIARDKDSCVRSRLDAAHELGHLVLHHKVPTKALNDKAAFKEIERQAFLFAGAFLMPAESFGAEIWSPSLSTFLALKERWRTAIGAMIKRCEALDMIGEEYRRRLWRYYSARGWRKSEPMDDDLLVEEPRLLSRSVRLLVDEGVQTRANLLEEFRLFAGDVETLCDLPSGYMSGGDGDVVQMPKLKRTDTAQTGGGGSVLPFNRRH